MTAHDDEPEASGGPPATSLRPTLGVVGDPWTMLILKEAYNGARRFTEFQNQLGIPRQTLSLRLAHLGAEQMLYRRFVGPRQATLEYAPTAKTWDFADVMYAVWLWHVENHEEIELLPFDIVHIPCGERLRARYRCRTCREPVEPGNVTVTRVSPEQFDPPRERLSRRNDAAPAAASGGEANQRLAATIIGDAPCNEILYMLFQGPAHLSRMAQELHISPAVLRSRLEKLDALGLIEDRQDGRRTIYSATAKADGLYPLLLSLAAWGDRWCRGGRPPPEMLIHDCGAIARGRFACDACGGWVERSTVRIAHRPGGEP